MPKKVPMSERREWLRDYDEGKPAAEIAKSRKRALKVIKRGMRRHVLNATEPPLGLKLLKKLW